MVVNAAGDMREILSVLAAVLGMVVLGSCSPVSEKHGPTDTALVMMSKLRGALESDRVLEPRFREPANLRRYFGGADYERYGQSSAFLWSFDSRPAADPRVPLRPTVQEMYIRMDIEPKKSGSEGNESSNVTFSLGIPNESERPTYEVVAAAFGSAWKPESIPPAPPAHGPVGFAGTPPPAAHPHGNASLVIHLPDSTVAFRSILLQFDETGRLFQFETRSQRRQ